MVCTKTHAARELVDGGSASVSEEGRGDRRRRSRGARGCRSGELDGRKVGRTHGCKRSTTIGLGA